MGSGFNMPDGVYERDIPGYNDIEVTVPFTCGNEDCGMEWEENDVPVDPDCECDCEAVCPGCGTQTTVSYLHNDHASRYDAYDDYTDRERNEYSDRGGFYR